MTAFAKVRLATSSDTVTLLNGAAVEPWARALPFPNPNAATAAKAKSYHRKNRACFFIVSSLFLSFRSLKMPCQRCLEPLFFLELPFMGIPVAGMYHRAAA